MMEPLKLIGSRVQFRGFTVLLWVCALMAIARIAAASPQLNPASSLDFFTNVSSRLLTSQLSVNLSHIQIYPTNQYTPAVHRLLQVTANILDATTTNYYPSVFRPLFWKTNEDCGGVWQTNVYIAGYQYVQEPLSGNTPPIFSTPTDASDAQVPFGLSGISNNIYGIPWVIGVKKGLPNFNGLELDNCFFIERELQFNRNTAAPAPAASTFPFGRIYTTNQMYIVGVSNSFVMADWNSYASNYSDPVTIVTRDTFSFGLSNDAAGYQPVTTYCTTNSGIQIVGWPGTATSASYSFVLPLGTNVCIPQNLSTAFNSPPSTNNTYIYCDGSAFGSKNINGVAYTAPCFIPASGNLANLDVGTPPLPHLVMQTTNRLQAWILDDQNPNAPYILDYVQLGGMNSYLDVNQAIVDPDNAGTWSTNMVQGVPYGIYAQFFASSIGGGLPQVDSDDPWSVGGSRSAVPGTSGDTSQAVEQAYFSAFFSPIDEAPYSGINVGYVTNISLSVPSPYMAMRLIVQKCVYLANDPLVHYMTQDLCDYPDSTNGRYTLSLPSPTPQYIGSGHVSDRYMPWGLAGNLAGSTLNNIPVDNNAYNLSYKDPLVVDSDAWDFPTNQALNASWLGQVHRGTPWQTIYLKSPNILTETEVIGNQTLNIGIPTWLLWTGDTNLADAASMAPVRDWQIASLLASLFNTNNEASLFSPNDPNPSDWENLLNGMTVLTNDLNDYIVSDFGAGFATLTISSASSQASEIANAIESTRTSLSGQLFVTPGNIFAVPQLSSDSPYLNLDAAQMDYGISDLAYEAIPDQLLPLLRVDSIGSMSAANGQTVIQFTGADNHVYAIQASPNLINWTTISTNSPVNGIFTFTNNVTANAQFYRTVLLY